MSKLLGEPTLNSVLGFIEAERHLRGGDLSGTIYVDGLSARVSEGWDIVGDPTEWIDLSHIVDRGNSREDYVL